MIPSLLEIARRFGLSPLFADLVMAAVLTGLLLFAQSIAGWFDDRNP